MNRIYPEPTKMVFVMSLMLLMPILAAAQGYKEANGICFEEHEEEAYIVRGETEYTGDVVIPGEIVYYDGEIEEWMDAEQIESMKHVYPVVAVNFDAFVNCKQLTSVTLPSTIKPRTYSDYINDHCDEYLGCYKGCTALKKVVLPEGIKVVPHWGYYDDDDSFGMFEGCSSLESVNIDMSQVLYIGARAFKGCKNLKLEFPSNAIFIGSRAFEGCTFISPEATLNYVDVYSSIEDNAFASTNLHTLAWHRSEFSPIVFDINLKHLKLGKEVVDIYGSYDDENALESIVVDEANAIYDSRQNCNAVITKEGNELILGCGNTLIPSSVKKIGFDAFGFCQNLNTIVIPNSVDAIGAHAFRGSNLQEVTVPSSVHSYNKEYNMAFANCPKLKKVTLDHVQDIMSEMFSGCETLEEVIIDCVGEVYVKAFYNCPNIKTITCLNTVAPRLNGERTFSSSVFKNALVYIPKGSLKSYKNRGWSSFTHLIEVEGLSVSAVAGSDFKVTEQFDLQGITHKKNVKGINIIRMSNGQTKKVLVN